MADDIPENGTATVAHETDGPWLVGVWFDGEMYSPIQRDKVPGVHLAVFDEVVAECDEEGLLKGWGLEGHSVAC